MQGFTDFCKAWHIDHHLTSAHRAQSNGDGESGIKSVKTVLEKINKVDHKTVEQTVFNYNHQKNPDGSGSPSERFFGRSHRTKLPNSFVRNLEVADLNRIRNSKRNKLAQKQGRRSVDPFSLGDSVRVQDHVTKRWTIKGKI